MFEKINETYGIKLTVSSERKLNGVPLYMSAGRKIYDVQWEGITFLAVCVNKSDKFGSIALGKQLIMYQKAVDMPVAYIFEKLTFTQRAALIKNNISFISEPDQIYLPFMGIMLKNNLSDRAQTYADKMMPATQSVFLYLVYKAQEGCLKKDAADSLGLTRTSVSRASEQLAAMGLIREERSGKEIRMYPIGIGPDVFEFARPYLLNPVQRIIYTENSLKIRDCVLAGESALGERTMLNKPDIPVYAVDKNSDTVKNLKELDPKWEANSDICMIEIWKYNPQKFASGGCVDPISLAMSLEGQEDERVEGAVEEYMESYEW